MPVPANAPPPHHGRRSWRPRSARSPGSLRPTPCPSWIWIRRVAQRRRDRPWTGRCGCSGSTADYQAHHPSIRLVDGSFDPSAAVLERRGRPRVGRHARRDGLADRARPARAVDAARQRASPISPEPRRSSPAASRASSRTSSTCPTRSWSARRCSIRRSSPRSRPRRRRRAASARPSRCSRSTCWSIVAGCGADPARALAQTSADRHRDRAGRARSGLPHRQHLEHAGGGPSRRRRRQAHVRLPRAARRRPGGLPGRVRRQRPGQHPATRAGQPANPGGGPGHADPHPRLQDAGRRLRRLPRRRGTRVRSGDGHPRPELPAGRPDRRPRLLRAHRHRRRCGDHRAGAVRARAPGPRHGRSRRSAGSWRSIPPRPGGDGGSMSRWSSWPSPRPTVALRRRCLRRARGVGVARASRRRCRRTSCWPRWWPGSEARCYRSVCSRPVRPACRCPPPPRFGPVVRGTLTRSLRRRSWTLRHRHGRPRAGRRLRRQPGPVLVVVRRGEGR